MAKEIVGVQYLRGLAALAVVVDHSGITVATPKYFGTVIGGGLLNHGASGVDLFFLISGFIITATSLDADWQPKVKLGAFFGRRFIRIVPLMWIAIVSYAVLKFLGRGGFDPQPYLLAMV